MATSFKALGLRANVCNSLISTFGLKEPTKTQAQFIPSVLSGRDVILRDRAGSGKSMGLAACLASMSNSSLYISPNLELAQQMKHWVTTMSNRTDIMIGTPGHLLTHLPSSPPWRRIVIDEADQALKLPRRYAPLRERRVRSLHPKPTQILVDEILKRTTTKPQMILASATLNRPMREWLFKESWVKDPVVINAATPEMGVQHHCLVVSDDRIRNIGLSEDERKRGGALAEFNNDDDRMVESLATVCQLEHIQQGIIFIDSSLSAEAIEVRLSELGVPARDISLYSQTTQPPTFPSLWIATEFSGRGVDIPHASHVFILGRPSSTASYVHMAGRTGRLGPNGCPSGKVFCFLRDHGHATSRMLTMCQLLGITIQPYEHVD